MLTVKNAVSKKILNRDIDKFVKGCTESIKQVEEEESKLHSEEMKQSENVSSSEEEDVYVSEELDGSIWSAKFDW